MTPTTEQELAEAVASATGPLRIQGGGTRDIGIPADGTVLSTSGLSGVSLYEPGAMTLVVQAGTPMAEIDALLAAQGQRLPFEPMDHRGLLGTTGTPTIGGVVAANVSGPRRIQVGAARDFALGVRFVDGSGQVLKNGGRVMKNVTGYDLVKLMAGSWGTLGVLSQVSLKVGAIPEVEATLVARGLDAANGIAALSGALGSPFDITGAAHLGPDTGGDDSETRIRFEGLAGAVAYRLGAMADRLGGDWTVVEGAASSTLWQQLRDVAPFADADIVWRLSVTPSSGPLISAMLAQNNLSHRAIFDWGGGLIWLAPDANALPDGGAKLIRAQMAALGGGHATLVKAPVTLRRELSVFEPEPPAIAALTTALRHKFDPRGILNPGLMGA